MKTRTETIAFYLDTVTCKSGCCYFGQVIGELNGVGMQWTTGKEFKTEDEALEYAEQELQNQNSDLMKAILAKLAEIVGGNVERVSPVGLSLIQGGG